MSDPACSARSEALNAMEQAEKRHRVVRHPDAYECAVCGDIGWAVDRHARMVHLDALLAARRTVPCATCGGKGYTTTCLIPAIRVQCEDCTDGTTDAGSLAVALLAESAAR